MFSLHHFSGARLSAATDRVRSGSCGQLIRGSAGIFGLQLLDKTLFADASPDLEKHALEGHGVDDKIETLNVLDPNAPPSALDRTSFWDAALR
ncbi:hypothetical protein B0H16DRAFT_1738184 [Mycena metata]|uniref:Uncharacterized protein n=1 Tax=Mycena metata TaxID=1033252 RepID=A0AAD7HIP8_9AGAR|nr:hypothetical protein B0H16DRAFT_1738184 [Mycena metata]